MRYEASPFEFDNEIDLKALDAWFIDELHGTVTPDYISASWTAEAVSHGFCYAAEDISLPACKGILWRDYEHCRFIISPKLVESEEEIGKRQVKFQENLQRLSTEFAPWWEEAKEELKDIHRPFQELDLNTLTNTALARKLDDMRALNFRMCEIHFKGMYDSWALFLVFRKFCQEVGMDVAGETFTNLIKGYDNDSYRQDRELYFLSRKVEELGLSPIFELPAEKILPELEKEQKAQEWIGEFNEWMEKWGWKIERCWWLHTPSWLEEPRFAIAKIKEYLKLAEIPRVAEVEKARDERLKTAEKVRSEIPEDKRETFDNLLDAAGHADAYSEEHDVWCEWLNQSVARKFILEAGKRLVEAGTIDNVDDVFMLWLDEIKKTLYWPEKYRYQSLVEERRAKTNAVLAEPIPPIFSNKMNMEEAFEYMMKTADPILIYTIVGELPQPNPDVKADLLGVGGAPGVVEGTARLIMDEAQLDEIQPGEILVCPTTSITWTTAFSIIKGIVVDRGGILSHAAIVSRQFGIPCVINTFTGTSTIKTGQRLKIDGTTGAVNFLD